MCAQSTIINSFVSRCQPGCQFNKLLGSLLLVLALGNASLDARSVYSKEASKQGDRPWESQVSTQLLLADSEGVDAGDQLSNGQYLYGESPQPEQVGQTYTVFEVLDGQIVGAFYQPRSSFDCFYGHVEGDRLAVTIIDSYEQRSYRYSIALSYPSETTSSNPPTTIGETIGLVGFYRINQVSANDQRILGLCQKNYQ